MIASLFIVCWNQHCMNKKSEITDLHFWISIQILLSKYCLREASQTRTIHLAFFKIISLYGKSCSNWYVNNNYMLFIKKISDFQILLKSVYNSFRNFINCFRVFFIVPKSFILRPIQSGKKPYYRVDNLIFKRYRRYQSDVSYSYYFI